MYFPLLRARQFELLALRELAIEGSIRNYITPIFEPVKESVSNLNLANNIFVECEQDGYLILNPRVGEMSGDDDYYANYYINLVKTRFKPAFYYRNNGEYILNCINHFKLADCLIICQNDVDPTQIDFQSLSENPNVRAFNVEDPGRNRSLSRYLKGLGKDVIRLDDPFEKEDRNSDFLPKREHMFSEENIYYSEEGFAGFSDYTVLPSTFSDGGSTPRAVVIHLTYLKGRQIWIRHFTSNSNFSIANVQGKFAEAADKAMAFCVANRMANSAIDELSRYFHDHHYPGLGMVKKISIKNHLLVVTQFLSSAS